MRKHFQKARDNRAAVAKRFLSRFARDEDGALIVFGVYVFLIILMVGGIGIDLMRFERDRAELQNTLDRAVLAAADLDQQQSPSAVVADYFAKAGLSEYLTSVTVDEGLGYRLVSGTATAEIQTQFMHMTGVDTLSAEAASTAEERIDGVEISLVLDVSGSMNSNNRLPRLKVAARDFIDDMVENTQEGKLSISIIPYATQVAMSTEFINEFNITQDQIYSNCINFQNNDYLNPGMSLVDNYEATMHFDSPWRTDDRRDNNGLVRYPICSERTSREMMVMQKDATALKDFISDLSATGNTSIDIGMKWGTALLDPSLQPVVDNLISSGTVDPVFADLPREYDASDTLKVIVLMTDGQNTSQYYINPGFRQGMSDIWWNDSRDRYSVYDADRDEYFWPHTDDWESDPYDDSGSGTAVQLSFAELWARTSIKWNARYNIEPAFGHGAEHDWINNVYSSVGGSTKNAQTRSICDTAKAQQIIVFTIGFEAPASGQAVLADCASSPAHFFDVDGMEINEAFAAIASSIRKLRLTQ